MFDILDIGFHKPKKRMFWLHIKGSWFVSLFFTFAQNKQTDQSLLFAQWVAREPSFLHKKQRSSDQTGSGLTRVFRRLDYFVGIVVQLLICYILCHDGHKWC